MEIFDKDGKSQVDGKTIKKVFSLFNPYVTVVAFTDRTYALLPAEKDLTGKQFDWPNRAWLVTQEFGGQYPALSSGASNLEFKIKQLIDAGLYTEDEIAEMREEAVRWYQCELRDRIFQEKKQLARLEQELSQIP